MRINKFISLNSEYSRRKADELIKRGAVSVNGRRLTEMGEDVDPEDDDIRINGKRIGQDHQNVYIALNKPAGYITTKKDERNRHTVMDLVPNIGSLKPAGRLDKETEGLIILSNDGNFINSLTHPKFECEKEYFVVVEYKLSQKAKKMLEDGIVIESKKTAPAQIHVKSMTKYETALTITIHEGRKRQIRKMFDLVSHPVKYLKRIRIGKIHLGDLNTGEFRYLTNQEINAN